MAEFLILMLQILSAVVLCGLAVVLLYTLAVLVVICWKKLREEMKK